MADETNQDQTGITTDGNAQPSLDDELSRERKRAGDAYAQLRKRDVTIASLTERLNRLEQEIPRQRESKPAAAAADPMMGDDPEPEAEADPVGWMKWARRQDQREKHRERAMSDMENLNAFGAASEAIARQQVPDYDQAMDFLRLDYRKELEESGELDETAFQLMNDANQKQNILNFAAQKGLSELDAAREMCAQGAWEWRRQRIVAAQRRLGGNPALKAVEMAKRRGYPGQTNRNLGSDGNTQGTTSVVDDSIKELERRRNLRAAGNTTADVREGGEMREKRAWTYEQLQELQRTNPREFRRVTAEIAADADSNPNMLGDIIRH